jgi:hypothetical protein
MERAPRRSGNPQALEALLKLKVGKLKQLGRLPEIDLLGEVIAQDPGFQQTAVGIFSSGANGESAQEPVVESVQEDDTLLSSARNNGKLSLLDPIQDLSGPLGQVGGGDEGSHHRTDLLTRGYLTPSFRRQTPGLNIPQQGEEKVPTPTELLHHSFPFNSARSERVLD